ncbi:endonuclease/exonuclease/phosphatase family protein [Alishewanella sp. d11]|uniref:endonuclease/exonuclease/phosphatase family protein n=1 Tax=Alishewanella sp. d11 TaxID=3414030 RepID=UPI003BF836F0
MKLLKYTLLIVIAFCGTFTAWVYYVTYQPKPIEPALLQCSAEAPLYDGKQPLKVMVYNVQYFAGKDYVFYYDLPDAVGPDKRPKPESVQQTLAGIAALIDEWQPDILLLQEVDNGAASTGYADQTQQLLAQLQKVQYPCSAAAYYWKAKFVPDPNIMGAVGMQLVTLSRFQLADAIRISLPQVPLDPITRQFYLKRAILQVELPTEAGGTITVLNTHLDAFVQGFDTMQQQVARVHDLLTELDQQQQPWLIGGDFNLLAPGQFAALDKVQQGYYVAPTELSVLTDRWSMLPSLEQIKRSPASWFTHFPNDPRVTGPDRTIDYLFYSSQWSVSEAKVLNEGAPLQLSDHFPIWAKMQLSQF